ncbi:MAG TPA: hypothetical protein VMD48_07850 [Solirubrobacteraceae bacterium]|nr:hypothetical protein [Solirubrobacteraceae bacterium]
MSSRHRLAVVLAAVGGAVALAACGAGASSYSASGSGSAAASSTHAAFVDYSKCMRAHGVPNFPDPSSGGGIQLSASSGINPFSPAFKAAQSHCRKLLPGGGPPTGPPSAQAERAALETSECMRKHGVSGFPDPTLKAPSSPAGYGAIEDRGGVILAIPSTINVQSPAFQQAAKACQFG